MLHVSESHVGLLFTALSAGIGIGSLAAGTLSGDRLELGLVPIGSALMAIFGILLGLTANYSWALVWLVGYGIAAGLFAVPLNAWLQEEAGALEKGRILATNNFANMVGVIFASGILWLLHDRLHLDARRIFLITGLVTLIVTVPVAAAMPLALFRFLMRGIVTVLFRVRVEGAENIPVIGGALLVANHLTYADAIFVGLTTERTPRFMMRRIFYVLPVANFICRKLRAIPIEETTPRAIVEALRDAHSVLESGDLLAIFPEGHITLDGEIKEFKRGYERMVRDLAVPIIPIAIHGAWGHPLSCKGGDAFRSWSPLWRPEVTIKIGRPIREAIAPEALPPDCRGPCELTPGVNACRCEETLPNVSGTPG